MPTVSKNIKIKIDHILYEINFPIVSNIMCTESAVTVYFSFMTQFLSKIPLLAF